MKTMLVPILAGVLLLGGDAATAGSKREEAQKLMKKLAKDKDPETRAMAARELGDMGATDAVPALAAALTGDREEAVRASASAALWKLGEASREAIPALKDALRDAEPVVVWNAAGALSELGVAGTELLPAYKSLMLQRNCDIRVSAAVAARDLLKPSELFPVAMECRTAEDVSTANNAAQLLGEIVKTNDRSLIPAIVKTVAAGGPETWRYVDLLGRFKPPPAEAITPLTALAGDRSAANRRAAISTLGDMGSAAKSAVPMIADRMLTDPDPEVRQEAAETLGELGPTAQEAIPKLIQSLQQDKEPKVRAAACEGLQEMHGLAKSAIPALNAALKDPDAYVRGAAQRALMRVDPKR